MKKMIVFGALITAAFCFIIWNGYISDTNIDSFFRFRKLTQKTNDENVIDTQINEEHITNDNVASYFYIKEIDDELYERIHGLSYKDNDLLPVSELRYLHVLHYDFNNEIKEGELICNKEIASKLIEVFQKLFVSKYQIEKIKLIDEYMADDELSMEDNNSSCFNYRNIAGTNTLSNHGKGLAVDINPLYNPYIRGDYFSPTNSEEYLDRTKNFEHKITHDDICYKVFTEAGFVWGGDWDDIKDYQHFEIDLEKK